MGATIEQKFDELKDHAVYLEAENDRLRAELGRLDGKVNEVENILRYTLDERDRLQAERDALKAPPAEEKAEWPEVAVLVGAGDSWAVTTNFHTYRMSRRQAEAVKRAYDAMVKLAAGEYPEDTDGNLVGRFTARRILKGE